MRLLEKVVAFELLLIVIAYTLGVDLESELRSWYFIAFEIWAVGMAAGAGGSPSAIDQQSHSRNTAQLT